MMRQTGGTAVGEISTRSSPFCFAMTSAWGGGMMPSCWPLSSITRISRTRIRSLTRTRSSRRGLLSKGMIASFNRAGPHPRARCPRAVALGHNLQWPRGINVLGIRAAADGVARGDGRSRKSRRRGAFLFAFARNLVARVRDEIADRPRALITAGSRPDRNRSFGRLTIADHQHVRNLLQLGLSNLISDFFLALVDLSAQARGVQLVAHRRAVRQMP